MKLVTLLMVVAIIQVSAATYAQHVTLKATDISLATAIEHVKAQTGYGFFLKGKQVANKRVSVDIRNADLHTAMDILLEGLPLSWVLEDETIIIHPSRSPVAKPLAVEEVQQRELSGRVTDDTGSALQGVTVTVKGTGTQVITNSEGQFRIQAAENADVLVFSIVGFEQLEAAIGSKTVINATLQASLADLEEVVVVGFGTQKKVNLTGAVDKIDGETMNALKVNTMGEALMGQVPNLNVGIADGRPGRGASFNIRGVTSLNGGSPLIIIDGVPSSEAELNNLSPRDVEDISVLKDAASAAIYGARGAFWGHIGTDQTCQGWRK